MTAQMKLNSDSYLKRFNLRSSSALNYCFGQYTRRKDMLQADLSEEIIPIGSFMQKYVDFGNKHEKSGIAKWIILNKKMPIEILDKQQNYIIQDFLNLGGDTVVDLSCTPDGRYTDKDNDLLLEIKCGSMGEKPHEFKKVKIYLAQISLQQYILNSLGVKIDKTHLVSWSFNGTKIWEIERNYDFEHYLLGLLEEYALALLGKGQLRDKPDTYKGKHLINQIYGDKDE